MKWLLYRLLSMSVFEIFYRFKQKLQEIFELLFFVGYEPKNLTCSINEKVILNPVDTTFEFDNVIDIFNLKFDYFNEINWSLDIQSGNEFPSHFSKKIDIRTNRYGNAKVVWEINRMTFLPGLCFNYMSTNNEAYLTKFIEILSSWKKQNPYLKGINWYSNIEISIRLINWFFCWCILNVNKLSKNNPEFDKFVKETWLPLIYLHCKYSAANPSLFSSSNNHKIAEHAGLFIASCLWKFPDSDNWNKKSKRGLEKEIVRQHTKNGVNKEQAAEYIQFITDFFLYSYVIGTKSDIKFSSEFNNTFYKICNYINEFLDFTGKFPNYGDEDDGLISDFGINNTNNFKSILTSAAIIFKESKFINHSPGFDLKNKMLFGITQEETLKNLINKPNYQSEYYKQEGHFFIKKWDNEKENIYFYYNSAPLGFLSIAAHGHADALSFLLNIDNNPVFIDSGTFTYHNALNWRKYFMGTLAHNTVRVNKKDQATIGGPTLWLNHYKCKVIVAKKNKQKNIVKATHYGYKRLGVIHTREIIFIQDENTFIINDELKITKKKDFFFEIPFHIHPDISINKIDEKKYLLKSNDIRPVEIILPKQCKSKLIYGNKTPILGWYSKSFQNKQPCNVLYNTVNSKESFNLTTQLKIKEK